MSKSKGRAGAPRNWPAKLAGRKETYRYEFVRCSKKTCRCHNPSDPGHGPYWYVYYPNRHNKLVKKYIGKDLIEWLRKRSLL